ncbi:MAG: DUF885 domain-containing protein [bacterium]|nr:DUF885 domain-containing protein [bacterium]
MTLVKESETLNLKSLFQKYWDRQMLVSPSYATFCGINDYNDRLEDLSVESGKQHLSWLIDLRDQMLSIPDDQVDADDLISRRILVNNIDSSERFDRFPTHYLAINQMTGLHLSFYQIAKVHPFRTPKDLQDFLSRTIAHALQLNKIIKHLSDGMNEGWLLPKRVVDLVILQLEGFNNKKVIIDRIHQFILNQNKNIIEENKVLWEEIINAIEERLLPAYRDLIEFLSIRYSELARESVGLCDLPNGLELYEEYVRSNTTLDDLSASEIHELGLQEIDRIHSEMRKIQLQLGIEGDLSELFESFRNNSELHYNSREEIVEHHRSLLAEMDKKLPEFFDSLPENPYEVHALPSYQEKESPDAFYMPGNRLSGRPGIYYVNTYEPDTRGKHNAEVLAYHEAVPGHHLQISLAQELENLPSFRKHSSETAYVEGWALYTEKLCEEMGFYSQIESKFGRLSFEVWRACRLVVDTGLHAFGWSRQKAIEFMQKNTGLSRSNIEVEVDRYIVMPGQALSYKIGERYLMDLRNMVRENKGSEFEIKEFHKVLLENGALPLPILGEIVRNYYKL